MEKFFNNTRKLIFHKQKDILSSALILSSMFIFSSLLGLLRYRTYLSYFTREEVGLFLSAFRLPDFVFEILITGALSSAFIPLFIKYKTDQNKLYTNISTIINFIACCLCLGIILLFFTTDSFTPFILSGFTKNQIATVITISKILLVAQVPFMVFGNILSGISQANRIFIITAIAPLVYNLGIILGTILFSKQYGIYGPVIGVVAGSGLLFISQLPIIKITNFHYQLLSFKKNILHEFIHLFIPRVLTVLTNQIDLFVDLMLSSVRGAGSVAIFSIAQSLQFFPVTFIGIAYGQASLPYLADLFAEKKLIELKKIFVDSILQLLFLIVPLSLFFIFARTPIVRFAVGGPKLDWEGTVQIAKTLSFFSVSLPFHTIFYFITRAFYATHNSKTPFKINVFSTIINTILSMYFIYILKLPVWSLAISFAIAISINILLLLYFFYKEIEGFDYKKLFFNSFKIYSASLVSAIVAYSLMKILDRWFLDTTRTINVFFLLLIVFSVFGLAYLFLSWAFSIEEIYVLGKLLLKIKELKKRLVEVYSVGF